MESTISIVNRYSGEAETESLSCGNNLSYAELQAGENVIDLGCGRGKETLLAAHAVGGGLVKGLDITPKMIEVASASALEQGISNVEFVQGSLDSLPFPDNFADVVLSNCAINHVQDKETVYREIFRVLKPGGRFIVSDIMAQETLPPEISSDPEAIAACFGGAIPSDEYFTAIRKAGFLTVEILKERTYLKNGYWLISRTLKSYKDI